MSTILQRSPESGNTRKPPDCAARVSVGLPVYNGENFLAAAIESVLAQTFRDFVLIISDNASTDRTEDICRRYAASDGRIRYHRAAVNRGIVWNFNEVFKLSTSEYFMWFSHDDALSPQYLERCVRVLDSDPTAVLAYAACTDIDDEGRVLGVRRSRVVMESADPVVRFRHAIRLEHLCEPWCGLTRADVLRRTELFGSYADYDRVTIAELGLYGRLIEIPEPLFSNREHSNRSHQVYGDRLTRTRWLDPRNANAMAFPHSRELREFWAAVCRAPLARRDRLRCAWALAGWAVRYRRRLMGDIYAIAGDMLRSIKRRV